MGDDFQFADIFLSTLCVMPGHQSTIGIMYGLNGGLAYHSQLPSGRNNLSAIAIILFADNCSYDLEKGAIDERI